MKALHKNDSPFRSFVAFLGVFLSLVGVMSCLTGCGSLPSDGPSTSKILSRAKQENKSSQPHFTFIRVTESVIGTLRDNGSEFASSGFRTLSSGDGQNGFWPGGRPLVQSITVGDVVGVSIYTTGGGLFGGAGTIAKSSGGSSAGAGEVGVSMGTSVPNQTVDSSEAITVPYVGRIKVVGRKPCDVENEIAERMKGMAFTPYAVVTVGERRGGNLVTVTGDVKNPRRVEVPLSGLRILDAMTEAGGCAGKDFETMVTLVRGSTRKSETYSELLKEPSNNIYLQPMDTLVVKASPRSYMTFGATGQTLHPFIVSRMTVAEALSTANGLDDNRANPEACFIYRMESVPVLKKIGGNYVESTPGRAPTIYQINLRDPEGFFAAQQLPIQDKDLIYVGNAGSVGVQKFMAIIGSLTAPAVTGLSATAGVGALKSF